mmetsp:Transcript_131345/g.379967  ORF Transcript_131345/g.379967 Transcript_131345/m.379967 type:complete len:179 (-) Transcript_131345:90-626(-)
MAGRVDRLLQHKVSALTSGVSLTEGGRSMAMELAEQAVFVGVLKVFNESVGYGFIDCEETNALFGREVCVHQSQCEGVPVGKQVSFRVQMKRGQPHAWEVRHPPVDAASPLAMQSGPSQLVVDSNDASEWNEEARAWRPSAEANQRSGMAALAAHGYAPKRFPAPVLRQGTFVGWKGT